MYDLTTHEGVGYNADQWFFSASTVKAPFVAFASQDMVDGGRASLDEEVVEDVILDGTGIMSSDDIDRYDLQTVMANTIVHSDNTGYGLLRERSIRTISRLGALRPTWTPPLGRANGIPITRRATWRRCG